MEHIQHEASSIEKISLPFIILLCVLLFIPLALSPFSTDAFILPKEMLTITGMLLILVIGAFSCVKGKIVRFHFTPFDLPVSLFVLGLLLSALFAVNQYDSLIAVMPVIFAILLYFVVSNVIRTAHHRYIASLSLLLGGSIVSIISILSFVHVYLLPFGFAKSKTFTPFGSLLDQVVYLTIVLTIGISYIIPIIKAKEKSIELKKRISFLILSLIITIGLVLSVYNIVILQAPQSGLPILPVETGLQTGFAAISQDSGRVFQSFLFGTGYGTYSNDFTRFKLPSFNVNKDLWSLTFFRSSSFSLELLATTGIIGILSSIFLATRIIKIAKTKEVKQTEFYIACFIALLATLFLPFSFTLITLFFIVLGLFASSLGSLQDENLKHKFFDAEIHFSMQKSSNFLGITKEIIPTSNPFFGMPSTVQYLASEQTQQFEVFPILIGAILLIITGFMSYYTYRFIASDTLFEQSLVAATQNNGLQTYNLENSAISTFPYRDAYHRVFSQVNFQLANTLASQQPKGSTPSAQQQQTIYTLIQQAINEGRAATTVSPETASNWENLDTLYRNLIGFGKNAEQFAILANQQAIALDPNNPQEYISLGGIYYQLGQWDSAIQQFQIAVSLKPDYANAYYNLGHALEQKGDLANAKLAYEAVRSLVINQQDQVNKIAAEIDALNKKIGNGQQEQSNSKVAGIATHAAQLQDIKPVNQPPLHLNTSSAQLPQQRIPVQIPPPATASTSAQ